MIDKSFAEYFAAEWIAAWNSRNLDRVLAHYTDDFEFSSPFIVKVVGEPSNILCGKQAVGAYWATALEPMCLARRWRRVHTTCWCRPTTVMPHCLGSSEFFQLSLLHPAIEADPCTWLAPSRVALGHE